MIITDVTFCGFAAKDPELSYTQNTNTAVCEISFAHEEVRKEKGQEVKKTRWVRATTWGDHAEKCARDIRKGKMIFVKASNGAIRLEPYISKQTGEAEVSITIPSAHIFYDKGGSGAGASNAAPPQRPQQMQQSQPQESFGAGDMPDSFQAAEDDIPF